MNTLCVFILTVIIPFANVALGRKYKIRFDNVKLDSETAKFVLVLKIVLAGDESTRFYSS